MLANKRLPIRCTRWVDPELNGQFCIRLVIMSQVGQLGVLVGPVKGKRVTRSKTCWDDPELYIIVFCCAPVVR